MHTATSSGTFEKTIGDDIFGNPTLTVEGYSCNIRYAGEYYDSETGEYYLRSRYYDPSNGRFTTEDTYAGSESDPASLNLYTYCANDPIQYVDPTGHTPSLNDIAISEGYKGNGEGQGNAAFAKACAESLAAAVNSKNAGSGITVTAWQVYNTVTSSDPSSIYYATNGSSSQRSVAVTQIVSKPIPPDPSIPTTTKPLVVQAVTPPPPLGRITTGYSYYSNTPYLVYESEVGNSANRLLPNSTPDQTDRAILAMQWLGVDINKGYGADWNTPAYVLQALKNGLILHESSNLLENHSMQVILDTLGFQASESGGMDDTFGSYMIGAVRAIMAMNGQGWQGNEGGFDSNIGPNVGASIEKMLLGLVYAKDISSVRAMYNAEQTWQVAKYEGWEQQAQEQAARAAESATMKAATGANPNGTEQISGLTLSTYRYLFNEYVKKETGKSVLDIRNMSSEQAAGLVQGFLESGVNLLNFLYKPVAQNSPYPEVPSPEREVQSNEANRLNYEVGRLAGGFTFDVALAVLTAGMGSGVSVETKVATTVEEAAQASKRAASTTSGFYHSANPNVVESIQQNGFRTDLPNPQAAFINNRFGSGVYVADSPATALAERPGGTILQIDADIGRNLNVTNRGIIDYDMGQAIARGAQKHGFDSVTFNSAQLEGGTNTVIFDPTRVTIKEIMP